MQIKGHPICNCPGAYKQMQNGAAVRLGCPSNVALNTSASANGPRCKIFADRAMPDPPVTVSNRTAGRGAKSVATAQTFM